MNSDSAAKIFQRIFAARATAEAVVDAINDEVFSYARLEDLASRAAKTMALAAGENPLVMLFLPNGVEMVVSYLACFQAGITSVPVNWAFSSEELQVLIRLAKPTLIVADAATFKKLPPGHGAAVLVWGKGQGQTSLTEVAASPRLDARAFPNVQDQNLAHIVFSSGTTGVPKAIPLRFGRLIGHAAMFARTHALAESCRFYNVLPLAYLGGWYNLTLVPLLAGATVVLDREFGAAGIYRFWTTVQERGVTCLWFTPSMLSALAAIGTDDVDVLRLKSQIRWAMVGMAPLPTALKQRFEGLFGIRLQQSYGLSETFLFTSWQSDTTLPDGSVGKVLEGYDLKLVSDEILIKSAWMMDGYWHQDDLAAKSIDADGYLHTGDLGRLDADGNLFITGRIKDLIIRGGVNISPAEIEDVLLRCPGVLEAAVVGENDELYGEKVVAFVTTGDPKPKADVILRFCRQHLSATKVPAAVRLIDVMPLNASGKIHKGQLRKVLGHDR